MVGMLGLEPRASWSQTMHSSQLSYIPINQREHNSNQLFGNCKVKIRRTSQFPKQFPLP